MLDFTNEIPIPLAEACKLIPAARQGKRTHLSTLLRWILQGARGPGGETIHLEAIRLGNRWMTSREALQRFAERLTPPPTDTSAAITPRTPPRTPTQRQRASDRAEKELAKAGI
jgi:hypothetical protein